MKITISFKSPDAVDCALDDMQIDKEERDEIKIKLKKFIQYNEYVHIEFDTEAETARVLRQG